MLELLGVKDFIDPEDLGKLAIRMAMNVAFATLVIRGVYRRLYGPNEYVFTYFAFNLITFALCFLLRKVPIELGFALGLFAVFGILRYRTEPIGIRDLTYLFIVIGIAILNAVANKKVSFVELLFVNVAVVGMTGVLELAPFAKREDSQLVTYDNLELLRKNDEAAVIEDLCTRTGLDVHRYRLRRIDLLRDTAELTVFYAKVKRK